MRWWVYMSFFLSAFYFSFSFYVFLFLFLFFCVPTVTFIYSSLLSFAEEDIDHQRENSSHRFLYTIPFLIPNSQSQYPMPNPNPNPNPNPITVTIPFPFPITPAKTIPFYQTWLSQTKPSPQKYIYQKQTNRINTCHEILIRWQLALNCSSPFSISISVPLLRLLSSDA